MSWLIWIRRTNHINPGTHPNSFNLVVLSFSSSSMELGNELGVFLTSHSALHRAGLTEMEAPTQSAWPGIIMDPWWRILKAHNVCVSRSANSRKLRGLRISLAPTDGEIALENVVQRCEALRDALELVCLQSIVDYGAFVDGIVNQQQDRSTPSKEEKLLREVDAFPCHVDATVGNEELVVWTRTGIATLLTPRQLEERGQAFQDARQQLLMATDIRVDCKKFKISIGGYRGLFVTELANVIHSLPPLAAEYPFGQVLLDLWFYTVSASEQGGVADLATCLGDIHKRVQLRWVDVEARTPIDEGTYGHFLSACLEPEGMNLPSHGPAQENRNALGIIEPYTSHRLMTQLCSAVMSARGVENLNLHWTLFQHQLSNPQYWTSLCDQVRYKRWMVLALFSRLARHSIRKLHLEDFYVDAADMDDLEAFVLGNNQLNVLRRGLVHTGEDVSDNNDNDEAEEEDEGEATSLSRDQISLLKGTTLWLNSYSARSEASLKVMGTAELGRDCWADVVASDGIFHEMLVPGYGWCKVLRSDAQAHRTVDQAEPQDVGRLGGQGITSLELRWRPPDELEGRDDYPGFRRFLRLVGAPLKKLKVFCVYNFTPYVETIWTACPLLTELALWYVDADVLPPIVAAYECGKYHVTSLTLRRMRRLSGSPWIAQLCERLCDPARQISRILTKLYLGSVKHQDLSAIVRMLDLNRTLVSFTVDVDRKRRDPLIDQLRAKNHQHLPPLPGRTKLAFLSAVDASAISLAAKTRISPRRAIGLLDCDVISQIFEMAAMSAKRKVVVREW